MVRKINNDITHQLEKIGEFETKAQEYDKAIKKLFGTYIKDIHISSCKSTLGHMLGAAGAVEAAITALSIKRGNITPTINLENPDPECTLNYVTSSMNKDINVAVTNSFGFGGVNAVLVLGKF